MRRVAAGVKSIHLRRRRVAGASIPAPELTLREPAGERKTENGAFSPAGRGAELASPNLCSKTFLLSRETT